jgi:plasmid stabilization system protein ParE
MKTVRFHAEAEAEMIEAASYYEVQQENLGKRFLTSVQDALNRIQINPLLYQVVELDVRCCVTKTFPFSVLFRALPEQVVVVAVAHLHRDPNYWKDRLRKE